LISLSALKIPSHFQLQTQVKVGPPSLEEVEVPVHCRIAFISRAVPAAMAEAAALASAKSAFF
jgi:hypothetical protein